MTADPMVVKQILRTDFESFDKEPNAGFVQWNVFTINGAHRFVKEYFHDRVHCKSKKPLLHINRNTSLFTSSTDIIHKLVCLVQEN